MKLHIIRITYMFKNYRNNKTITIEQIIEDKKLHWVNNLMILNR